MRLWSLHPSYLDRVGLIALWREALLAQAVLRGRTRGYRQHPQLDRFRAHERPVAAIAAYLTGVHDEATARGYRFDASKIGRRRDAGHISVRHGQLTYEWAHLHAKLERRDRAWLEGLGLVKRLRPHPLFRKVRGDTEDWERA